METYVQQFRLILYLGYTQSTPPTTARPQHPTTELKGQMGLPKDALKLINIRPDAAPNPNRKVNWVSANTATRKKEKFCPRIYQAEHYKSSVFHIVALHLPRGLLTVLYYHD